MTGSVPRDTVDFLAAKHDDRRAQTASSTAAVYTAESQQIKHREDAARARALDDYKKTKRKVERKEEKMRATGGIAQGRLGDAFGKADSHLADALARRKADINDRFGRTMRYGKVIPQGKAGCFLVPRH